MATKKALLGFALGIFLVMSAVSQQVQVTVNVFPPYSFYPQDYVNQPSKIQVILTNIASPTRYMPPISIKLVGSITSDVGISIKTRANYKPSMPIVLNSGETKILSYTDVKDLFDVNSFEYEGISKTDLLVNGFKEGEYTFCAQAFDYTTNVQLSPDEPSGCSNPVIIAYAEPPTLITPQDGDSIESIVAQNLLFNWTPAIGVNKPVLYKLIIAEVINPNTDVNQLLNATSFPFFVKDNIPTTNYMYNMGNPKLEDGKTYACQVVAYDAQKQIKFINDGKSVPAVFTVKAHFANTLPLVVENSNLTLTLPYLSGTAHLKGAMSDAYIKQLQNQLDADSSKPDTLIVNTSNPLMFSWTWANASGAVNGASSYKYKLNFFKTASLSVDKSGIHGYAHVPFFTYSTDTLKQAIFTMQALQTAGFVFGHYYKFSLTAYDINNKEVASLNSRELLLLNSDTSPFSRIVTGNIAYKFGTTGESFPVGYTPIKISLSSALLTFFYATTDRMGNFTATVTGKADTTTRLSLNLVSPYYKQLPNGFKLSSGKDTIRLGNMVTEVFSYSASFQIKEKFKNYYVDSIKHEYHSLNVEESVQKPLPGLDAILYRKVKHNLLPLIEGTLNSNGKYVNALPKGFDAGSLKPIASAKTSVEINAKGKKITVVKFDRLVCNMQNGDEYFVKVITNDSVLSGLEAAEQKVAFMPKGNYIKGMFNPPAQTQQTHFQHNDTIFLISNQPPKSEIKGRLYYKWPNDATRRPLANTNFDVRVEYDFVVNGKAVTEMLLNKFSATDINGNEVETFDNGMVVGTGQTDGNGEFIVSVINHNAKGEIGTGTAEQISFNLGEKKTTKPSPKEELGIDPIDEIWDGGNLSTNPMDEFNFGTLVGDDFGTQQLINNNGLGGMEKTNVQNIGEVNKTINNNALQKKIQGNAKQGGGPCPNFLEPDMLYFHDIESVTGKVRRVLRIKITDSKYYYSPNKDIIVQPFDKADAGDFDAVVAEAKVIVKVKDEITKITPLGIKALVFRNLDDKNVPLGEGNQNGKRGKLFSPTFEHSATYVSTPQYLNKEFEWISLGETNSKGIYTVSRLLSNYKDNVSSNYSLQVSSNPNDNMYFYKADFRQIMAHQKVGYWNETEFNAIKWDTAAFDLKPLPSRIAGRTQDAVSKKSIENASVTLYLKKKDTPGTAEMSLWQAFFQNNKIMFTDTAGYFEFLNAIDEDNMKYELSLSKSGYNPDEWKDVISKTGSQFVRLFFLKPDAYIYGKVTTDDPTPKGAPSYIKVDDGKVFETYNEQGNFMINVPSGNNRKVYIIPKDISYFNDTISMNIQKGLFANDPINATAYRRKHRMRFRVFDEKTDKYIKGAIITFVHNGTKQSTSFAPPYTADFMFENVAVNSYSVKVEGSDGKTYIPKQINIPNNESKEFVTYPIKLKMGKVMRGIVKLDGAPVKNAFVYLDKSAMEPVVANQLPEMSARTDKDGAFAIYGIPLASSCTELVKATLDTTFTVVGAQTTVTPGSEQNVALNLKKFAKAKIDKFYDIPFSLEDMQPLNNDTTRMLVTGLVHLDKCTSQFGWFDSNEAAVRIRNAPMIIQKINNQLVAVAYVDSVEIDATPSIKMKFGQKYNVSVTHKKTLSQKKLMVNNLVLSSENRGKGYLNGKVKLIDNSFNFPSTYISFDKYAGEFYFGEISGNKIANNIRVLTMNSAVQNNLQMPKTYGVSDAKGEPITFSFLGFEANADPLNSFISTAGDLSLSVNVKCKLPNANPDTFSLRLNGLKIDNNSIQPYAGINSIKINIEKWWLEIKNWKIDVKEGGIVSTDGMVHTGTIDVPFDHFVLRPDLFVFDGFKMTNLQVGGGLTLPVNAGIKPDMVYDERTGSDQSGHWTFVLLGSEQNPVSTINLSPTLNKPLRIKYITLLSNLENMIGIIQDKFILQKVCYFNPSMFYAGTDAFMLSGGIDLNGPRLGPIAGKLMFKKGSGASIQFIGVDPINFEFEGKGYVKFSATNKAPKITEGKFELDGLMVEPNKFNNIECKFTALGLPSLPPDQRFKVEANNDFILKLAENAFDLKLKTNLSNKYFKAQKFNGMMVTGNDWDNLAFTGELIEKSAKPTLSNGGKNTVLTFTVYGDIQASSEKVEVSNLSPLPGLSLTYIFDERRLVGNLTLDKQPFGGFSVSGAMEFSIGKPGWYMAAAGQITGVPVVNDFSAGVLLGMYNNLPDNVIKIATQFSKTVPCALNDSKAKFSGFFITGQKSMPLIPNVDISLNVGVAAFYVKVEMPTLDLSLYTSFEPFAAKMGIGIYAGVYAGMSSFTCTNISGSAEIIGRVFGGYNSGNFTVGGDVCTSIGVDVSQGIPTVVGPCIGTTNIYSQSLGLIINASLSSNGNTNFGFDFIDTPCAKKCF